MSIVDRLFGEQETEVDTSSSPALDERSEAFESSKDTLFEALVNRRRRYIIDIVGDLDEGDFVTLGTLATDIAYFENDEVDSLDDVSSQQRKRVYVSLYQSHLPKLDEWGLVNYDNRSKCVTPTGGTRVAFEHIRNVDRQLTGREGWSE